MPIPSFPDAQMKLHRPTLLIVESDETQADALALVFNSMDYATMTAYDAHTAFDLAQLRYPDLLLASAHLNGTTGRQLATAIQQFAPQCKIILLVEPGEDATDQTKETLSAPGGRAPQLDRDHHILHKPLDPEKLHALLQEWELSPTRAVGLPELKASAGRIEKDPRPE